MPLQKLPSLAGLVLVLSSPALSAPLNQFSDVLFAGTIPALSVAGVTIGYTVGGIPSALVEFNMPHPGSVNGLTIEGSTKGVLTLDFAEPVHWFDFATAFLTTQPLNRALAVSLYAPDGRFMGKQAAPAHPMFFLSETQFRYDGELVDRVAISFAPAGKFFVFGNLMFETGETDTGVLLVSGLLLIGIPRLWRRRKPGLRQSGE